MESKIIMAKNKTRHLKPMITLGKDRIGFDVLVLNLIKKNRVNEFEDLFVKFMLTDNPYVIQFEFCYSRIKPSNEYYSVSKTRNTHNRTFFKLEWVKELYTKNVNDNKWDIYSIHKSDLIWECRFEPIPSSRINKNEINKLKSDTIGLYFLYDNRDEIIYIGISQSKNEGIRKRLTEHIKDKNFEYCKYIEYPENISIREKEIYHLNEYKRINGRLPYYNNQV